MSIYKQTKDCFIRLALGKDSVPSGLFELHQYFRTNEPISFKFEKQEDGSFVAISQNFRYGSIITSAKKPEELNEKVKDAILTAFEIPSSYQQEAGIHCLDEQTAGSYNIDKKEYAFA